MDQKYLVENQIDEGLEIAKSLVADGVDLIAAFWAYPESEDDGRWKFYLAPQVADEKGLVAVYQKLIDTPQKDEDAWVSFLDVTVIEERNPLTQIVLDISKKHPGPNATRCTPRFTRNSD